jgi:hypothetical protein
VEEMHFFVALFCSEHEIIQHIFFYCPMARIIVAFGVTKPANIANLFGPWLKSFSRKQRALVLIGVATFCWALWISRNEMVFQKSKFKSFCR